jgi:hypothetical protein
MAVADRMLVEANEAAATAGKDLPPALETMLTERRQAAETGVADARAAAIVALPASTWREIEQRAMSTGIVAEQGNGGASLRLRAEVGPATGSAETVDAVAGVEGA